jgi:hypothetical protein
MSKISGPRMVQSDSVQRLAGSRSQNQGKGAHQQKKLCPTNENEALLGSGDCDWLRLFWPTFVAMVLTNKIQRFYNSKTVIGSSAD